MNPGLAFSLASMVSCALGVALMQDPAHAWAASRAAASVAEKTASIALPPDLATRLDELAIAVVALGANPHGGILGDQDLDPTQRAVIQRMVQELQPLGGFDAVPSGALQFSSETALARGVAHAFQFGCGTVRVRVVVAADRSARAERY